MNADATIASLDGAAKACTKCGQSKPMSGFYADAKGVLGRTSACKACQGAYASAWARRNKAARAAGALTVVASWVCTDCKQEKPAADFCKNNYNRTGIQSNCKTCRNKKQRWWALSHLYDLSRADYERMLEAQAGCCAICLAHAEELPRGILFVDHCHATGKVRGLLCESCNLAIGKLRDDPAMLRRAADYIEGARK